MKKAKRYLADLLMLMLLAPLVSSCSKAEAYLTYKDSVIPDYAYRYWFASNKRYFIEKYSDIEDTAECWNKKIASEDGSEITTGEYLEKYTLENAKSIVCELQMFKEYDLKLDDAAVEKVDTYISELVKYRYEDSKSAFNKALKEAYGINMDQLREILLMEKKAQAVESYLFGDSGIMKPTDAEKEQYYTENYKRLQVLLIKTYSEYVLDEDGNVVKDDLGMYKIKYYTEEEIAEKMLRAAKVEEGLEIGTDFEKLIELYGELKIEGYPNGFYVTGNDYEAVVGSGYDPDVFADVLKQETGTVKRYDLEKDAVIFVKSLPLLDKAYESESDAGQFDSFEDYVITEKYRKILAEMWKDISVDDRVYTLKTVDVQKGIF